MANKRNKKKLNSKQANKISLLISAIYFICMFVRGMISKPTGEYAVCYWAIGCFVGTMFIYLVFYSFIFKVEERKIKERSNEIETATMQYLSHIDFKQVYFLDKDYKDDSIDMLKQIMQKEECKFYAKLTQSSSIHLIAKDKHDEEVYNVEIGNHCYFNSNFTFESPKL